MTDKIVYLLITEPGGIDGKDCLDKGGQVRAAAYDRQTLERHPGKPWCHIEPRVIDVEQRKRHALAKLDPLDKLVLELK